MPQHLAGTFVIAAYFSSPLPTSPSQALRDEFGYVPRLSKEQFFSRAFAELKMIFTVDVIEHVQRKDKELQRAGGKPVVRCAACGARRMWREAHVARGPCGARPMWREAHATKALPDDLHIPVSFCSRGDTTALPH